MLLFASGINTVASLSPAPPNSDGFLDGLAYLFSLVLGVAGLLVVQIGYAFPAGSGRFRVGPFVDRSVSVRSGVMVVVYFVTALLMVYGFPMIVPAVTESTTYAAVFIAVGIAAVGGLVLTLLLALGGLLFHLVGNR